MRPTQDLVKILKIFEKWSLTCRVSWVRTTHDLVKIEERSIILERNVGQNFERSCLNVGQEERMIERIRLPAVEDDVRLCVGAERRGTVSDTVYREEG